MIIEKAIRTIIDIEITVLRVEGLITRGESADLFASALRAQLREQNAIVVDLLKCDYIDSTGVGELLTFIANGPRLVLSNVPERLKKLLELARLSEIIPIFDNEEHAIEDLAKRSAAGEDLSRPLKAVQPHHSALRLPEASQTPAALSVSASDVQQPVANAKSRILVEPRSLHIFLCHASDDKERVRLISRELNIHGVDVWFDEEKLLPGEDWRHEIRLALREVDAVIVCLSATAVTKKGYVQKEIKQVLDIADEQPEGAIFVIPVKLEPCEVPQSLRRWQWVDSDPNGIDRLVKALARRALQLGVAPPW